MPIRYRRNHRHIGDNAPLSDTLRLWVLRLLVPLGGHRHFLDRDSFSDEGLARALGFGRMIDAEAEEPVEDEWDADATEAATAMAGRGGYQRDRARASLRRMHRQAERSAGEVIEVTTEVDNEVTPARDGLPPAMQPNLDRLARLVGLTWADRRVLEFAVMLKHDTRLAEAAELIGELPTHKVHSVLAHLLDLPELAIRNALSRDGALSRTGLLTIDSGRSRLVSKLDLIAEDFADDVVSGDVDPLYLLRESVAPCPPPHLSLADYNHVAPTLDLMLPYLRQVFESGGKGVNIFIHGLPGTGKSQLAGVIAAALGCEPFLVGSQDEDGDPIDGERRLRAFHAAQSILTGRRALLVFDEAEDVFNDGGALFGRKSTAQTRKGWINRILEENPVPCLWLSNEVDSLDPAFVRRFDMVFELPIPPRGQRQRILGEICGDLVGADTLVRLAESDELAPAVASRAAHVVRTVQLSQLSQPSQMSQMSQISQPPGEAVERLIGQTLEAQGHPVPRRDDPNRLPAHYDPALLNADADLESMAAGLASSRQGRLCLFGPAGTGKTAFGRWLADRLGMPLHVRRASDLISMWVGGSEKNIASAFREAEQDRALLLIDEVDGFLRDRREAQRSWEVTQVNELLTQMEGYAGVFVASTNLMDGIDPAALRRFDIKVRFGWLRPEQAWQFLAKQCASLGLEAPPRPLRACLDRLDKLTPGDFAAAARRHRFHPFQSAVDLVAALEAECALKEGGRGVIGFV